MNTSNQQQNFNLITYHVSYSWQNQALFYLFFRQIVYGKHNFCILTFFNQLIDWKSWSLPFVHCEISEKLWKE